jgi:uncharacterized protein YodC (DUF2158 family)
MTFAPGDIVALKSGGHTMTVVSADESDIDCLWLGDAGELFRQSIPAVALITIERDAEDEAEEDADDDEDDDESEDDEREEKRRA